MRTNRIHYLTAVFLAASVGPTAVAGAALRAQSQIVSPAASARINAPAQAGTSKIAFTSFPSGIPTHTSRGPIPFATIELYVVNADGSEKRLMARSRTQWGGWPVAWSPDGQTIAFHGKSVFLVNTDGSGMRNLTRELGLGDDLPVWSPEGKLILFSKGCCGQKYDIYVMNSDGSGVRRLTRCGCAASPIWSPNGRRIAFGEINVTFRPHRKPHVVGHPEVWLMNADGSGQRQLARGWPSAWSPDGRKLALVRSFPGSQFEDIYVVNADGSGQRRLTRHRQMGNGLVARWSPDGQRILLSAYQARTHGELYDIYVINADGSGEQKLTEHGYDARWSRDGEKISFVADRDSNYEIYVMNSDGSGRVNVSQTPLRDEWSHAWSPSQK